MELPADHPLPDHTVPFDELADRREAFGVRYAHIVPPSGGDLYLTRYGWRLLPHLLPYRWYDENQYCRIGERLAGSTGVVYRMSSTLSNQRRKDLIVKFARFAEEVPVYIAPGLVDDRQNDLIRGATFNEPFEEFSLLMRLRRGPNDDESFHIRTKRPLAIYSPPDHFQKWQLGRTVSRFNPYTKRLDDDQRARPEFPPLELDIERQYIMLYEWVNGEDAESCHKRGVISERELYTLTERVTEELARKGFWVLDNKPRHYVLRPRADGRPIRRNGELVYALVDFELLKPLNQAQ